MALCVRILRGDFTGYLWLHPTGPRVRVEDGDIVEQWTYNTPFVSGVEGDTMTGGDVTWDVS